MSAPPAPPGYTWHILSFGLPPLLALGCLRCGVMVANPDVHDVRCPL